MKASLIIVLFISTSFIFQAISQEVFTESKIVKLIESKENYFILAKNEIYTLSKRTKSLSKYASAPSEILDAALLNDSLFLGTQSGLYVSSFKNKSFQKLSFESGKEIAVNVVFADKKGQMNIGTEAYGLFKIHDQKLKLTTGLFPLNCGTATLDSSIWIGTNSGLNRGKNGNWMRFNEEGVSNYEIPDNIVEKLIVDEKGILWIVTSEGMSYFELNATNHGHSHLPSTKFLGKPGNKVTGITFVNNFGYLFLTSMGTLYLPIEKGEDHIHEFEHPEDDKVENHKSLRTITISEDIKNMPIPEGVLQSINKKELLFFAGNKLLIVNKKNLQKRLGAVL